MNDKLLQYLKKLYLLHGKKMWINPTDYYKIEKYGHHAYSTFNRKVFYLEEYV